jgi:hypothetical protein
MRTQRTMLLRLFLLFAGLAILKAPFAHAQRVKDINDNGWFTFNGDHRLTNTWGVHTEFQARRHNLFADPQQFLVRGGVNYYAGKSAMLTAGYAVSESYSGGEYYPEQRIWEQIQLGQSLGRLALTHRYRLEQRWVKSAGGLNYTYENRMRYMLRGRVPLKGPSIDVHEPYVSAYDEIFVGFGDNVPNIFDQNRISAGLGYKLSREASIETSYLYQITQQRNRTVFQHNHILVIGFSYNFDFRQRSHRQ